MFTDEPSPFRPRSEASWPVAALLLVVFAGMGVHFYVSHVSAHNEASKAQARTTPRPLPTQSALSHEQRARRQPVDVTAPVMSRHDDVFPGTRRTDAVDANARSTIYFCKSYSGGTFWSDTVCSAQGATIDRMTTVPRSLSFEQKDAIARGQAQEAASLYEPPPQIAAAAIEPAISARTRPAVCATYDQQIRDLDTEARSPLPASRQDDIRSDRMRVMTSRARERC